MDAELHMYMYVSGSRAAIDSDNKLSTVQHQAITVT